MKGCEQPQPSGGTLTPSSCFLDQIKCILGNVIHTNDGFA